ncbi:MAG: hypothetical protein IPH36_19660 [Saprospiraceae bacterium]|nr:hypothetical protein [Saprospiraceae bacterium]
MFGVERNGNLPALELKALTDFMNAGGGVFATGDHENLGQFMCSEIPRVRSMRKWYWPVAPAGRLVAPDGGSANRLDTTVVGDTANYQFDDQSDETPQNIIPACLQWALHRCPPLVEQERRHHQGLARSRP